MWCHWYHWRLSGVFIVNFEHVFHFLKISIIDFKQVYVFWIVFSFRKIKASKYVINSFRRLESNQWKIGKSYMTSYRHDDVIVDFFDSLIFPLLNTRIKIFDLH